MPNKPPIELWCITYLHNVDHRACHHPESVKSIEAYAFSGCAGLTSVTIPESVESIGCYAFYGCTGLTSITIPESVKIIRIAAFSRCTGLTSIVIPESVETIKSHAFYRCTGLTSITIPDSVEKMGTSVLFGCTSVRRVINRSSLDLGIAARPVVIIGSHNDTPLNREKYFLVTHWNRKSPTDITPSQQSVMFTLCLCCNRSPTVEIPKEMIQLIFSKIPR